MDWILIVPAFLAGLTMREWTSWIASKRKKAPPPAPLPERAVGDVLLHKRSGLPMVLLEQMTHDQFRARFITPQAKELGAVVGEDQKPMSEDDDAVVKRIHDHNIWPDYPHKLSDGEHANYTKFMLTEGK